MNPQTSSLPQTGGVIIRNPDGSTQQVPYSQLQQFDPQLYSQYVQNLGQPAASLKQTQASTGLTETEKQQQDLQLQKNNALNQISSHLNEAKGKGQYVDPQTYNHLKNTKPGLISDSEFDSNFGQFTDPSRQYRYNTDAGRVLNVQRSIITSKIGSQVNKILQNYDDLPHKGPLEGAAIQNPFYKSLFGGSQLTYEGNKNAIAANITNGIDVSKLPSLGLSASDIAQITTNLPSVGDNEGQVQSKLKNLNQLMTGITGQGIDSKILKNAGVKDLGINDAASVGKNLLTSLLSKATNVAQDVGTGIRNIEEQPQLQKQTQQAQMYEQEASGTKDAGLRKILLQDANNVRSGISSETKDISNSFSPDVNQNPIMRSILGASDVGGAAGLEGAVSGGASALGNILSGGAGKAGIAGDVLKSIVTLGRSGGKQGAGEAIETAAGKGVPIAWDDIANAAKEKAANLGTRVQKELDQLLMDEKPIPGSPDEIANPQISSPQALELRKGLGQRLPSGFYPTELQKIFGGGGSVVPRNKAVGILRDTVSSALKEAAPDIKNPDALYSFYSKIHGDAPTWAKRILVGTVADQFAKKLPAPARGLADILPALLAVH